MSFMAKLGPGKVELVTVNFGDVVQFATLESLETKSSTALAARFVITGIFGEEQLLFAAKIMKTRGAERLSMPGTMEPPVRRVAEEPWTLGRIATAMAWWFGSDANVEEIQQSLVSGIGERSAEFPAF